MSRRSAFLLALLIAVAGGGAAAWMPHPIRLFGVGVGDIGLPLAGIAQFERGGSPYDVRLQGSANAMYPFTTSLFLWPFRLVPLKLVVPLFVGLCTFCLAWGVLRNGQPWQLLIFLTPAYWSAVKSVQWSPLLTAALLVPALLPLAVVKPQLGIVLAAAGRWSWRTVAATLGLVALSLMVWPSWPIAWLRHGQLGTYSGVSPLLVIPGPLLLLALLRWRSRTGRLMLAMSVIAQRYFYDQLPLYLVPRSLRQMLLLLASSWAGVAAVLLLGWVHVDSGVQRKVVWAVVIVTLFLPALAMTLMNEREARTSGVAAPE